ncbi:hypothetical protein NMY22_g5022 [Coprinellus aureogranulatus]|nr:hypothetical protein NMY22_g5022 [Coprinellus aureogranulatus]
MDSLNVAPQYSFLSQPPSRQKRLMHSPVASPPRYALPDVPTSGQAGRRSSFTAKITAWASFVQPGSPAPVSPDRDPTGNLSRTGEGHHPSVSSSAEAVSPTTASRKTFDFKAVGYNSLFLPMPKTPENMSSMARTRAEKEGHLPKEGLTRDHALETGKRRKEE